MEAWLRGRYGCPANHASTYESSDNGTVYLPDLWRNDRTVWRDGLLRPARLANQSMVPHSRGEATSGGQARGQPDGHRDAQGKPVPERHHM